MKRQYQISLPFLVAAVGRMEEGMFHGDLRNMEFTALVVVAERLEALVEEITTIREHLFTGLANVEPPERRPNRERE